MTEAPFKSVCDALIFAFRFSSQQHADSPFAKMMRRAQRTNEMEANIGSGAGLVGLDGAGQAGMILGCVGRLKADQRNVIYARYCERNRPCCECGGHTWTEWYRSSVEELADSIRAELNAVVDIRLRRILVHGFFSQKPNYTKLAERFELNRETVAAYYGAIAKTLKATQFSAEDDLHSQLVDAGVVLQEMVA